MQTVNVPLIHLSNLLHRAKFYNYGRQEVFWIKSTDKATITCYASRHQKPALPF